MTASHHHAFASLLLLTLLPAWNVSRAQNEPDLPPPGMPPPIPTLRPPLAEEVGPVPGNRYARGFATLPGLSLDTSFDSAGWIPQGPGLTRDSGANIAPDNPTSGCVTCVAPHPTNQDILYIGTANGGVWKTTNARDPYVRWTPLTDDQRSLSIGGIALDPADNTGNTLVAGIGRRSSFNELGGALTGLLRTTDGGATWTRLGETTLAECSTYQLTVRGATLLVAVTSATPIANRGLYRSTDTGGTFVNLSSAGGSGLPSGSCSHLAADPSNPNRYFAHIQGQGVYRSSDSGATWTSVNTPNGGTYLVALSVGPNGTVFAAEFSNPEHVYRSTNQGGTWVELDTVTAKTNPLHGSFVADPTDSNIVYLAGVSTRPSYPYNGRVVRGNASLGSGAQWTSIAKNQREIVQGQPTAGTAPHTDSRDMVFTAGHRLIECDDGGIYELPIAHVGSEGDGAGGGSLWRSLNGDLRLTEMYSVAYDRVARIFIGGTQDNGFQEQLTPGVPAAGSYGWTNPTGGDGGGAVVDVLGTAGQSVRYGSSQYLNGLFRATYNAGNVQISYANPLLTFTGGGVAMVRSEGGNIPFQTPIALNAVAAGRLIISGNANLYESTDQGDTVQHIGTVGANRLAKIACGGKLGGIANSEVLFFGSGSTVRYRTAAGSVSGNIAFPGGTVQGIVFDPENWKNTYILGTTVVYSANDIPANGAGAFTNITGNLTGVGTFHTLEYLTLPTGNAIMAGTDTGAYIMRVASPGVWKTLGDNLPHVPVFDSHFDAAGQVLAVSTLGRGAWLYDCKPVKAIGQYGETFQAYPNGATTLAPSAGELFSNQLGSGVQVADDKLRELQLTANGVFGTRTAFRLPDLNPGAAVPAFSAKWNATIYGNTSAGIADGFSFNFGPLGAITETAFTDGTYFNEDGFRAGLTVSVRTWDPNTPGYYVRVNGAVVPGGFVAKSSSAWGNLNTTRHFFEVDWRFDTGLTLRVDGVAIFTNLATPGYFPAASHRFVFGGRTGGVNEEVRLDNITIFTGGVLNPVAAAAPYYFSGQNTAVGAGADKAFDGNAATKWLTPDYTGFIGAGFPAAKTIRAYTLTSGNDEPTRDPVAWDFQTGDDGALWSQHGAQAAQYFVNRSEPRAFVVANPAANTKFRMHISENRSAAEMQLSEFQAWELTQAPLLLIVTNANDSGAGSLRQAIISAPPGGLIQFAPGLSGTTITLTSGEQLVDKRLAIDASALPGGITISGGGTSRTFRIVSAGDLSVRGLTLTGGSSGGGGAIYNLGMLMIENCTLSGNASTDQGGAVRNSGTLTAIGCTFSNNTAATNGGAVSNDGASANATITRCTFFGNANTGPTQGGGALNHAVGAASMTLTHCTIAGNSAAGSDGGGGIRVRGPLLVLSHCIVAGNTVSAGTGADLNTTVGVALAGANIIRLKTGAGTFTGSGTNSTADPLLALLGNYGGPTQTMALRPGSPARNAATGSTSTSDQRGFPVTSTPDIGAYESGTNLNCAGYLAETLPISATAAQIAPGFDFDGDGVTNESEWAALTDPASAASFFRITSALRNGANVVISFPSVSGKSYTLWRTDSLSSSWIDAGQTAISGNGTVKSFTIPVPTVGVTKRFFRVKAE